MDNEGLHFPSWAVHSFGCHSLGCKSSLIFNWSLWNLYILIFTCHFWRHSCPHRGLLLFFASSWNGCESNLPTHRSTHRPHSSATAAENCLEKSDGEKLNLQLIRHGHKCAISKQQKRDTERNLANDVDSPSTRSPPAEGAWGPLKLSAIDGGSALSFLCSTQLQAAARLLPAASFAHTESHNCWICQGGCL